MDFEDQLKRVIDGAVQDLRVLTTSERNRARQQGVDEGRAQGRKDSATGILDAFRALDRARSLTEILDTLAGCAGREADRAAVLVVSGHRARGWQLLGFDTLDGAEAGDAMFGAGASLDITLDDAGIVGEAVRTGGAVRGAAGREPGPPPFALPLDSDSLAIPIALHGDVVAVLYADAGLGGGSGHGAVEGPWREVLEIVARHAAKALEALTAIKAARALAGVSGATSSVAEDATLLHRT
ncbi:MAG TPA: hypothetical protein VGY48_34040 [Vicinamibacterales bacterium]|nr:hypothetical protein [Vicinamibacterales bacterium]